MGCVFCLSQNNLPAPEESESSSDNGVAPNHNSPLPTLTTKKSQLIFASKVRRTSKGKITIEDFQIKKVLYILLNI